MKLYILFTNPGKQKMPKGKREWQHPRKVTYRTNHLPSSFLEETAKIIDKSSWLLPTRLMEQCKKPFLRMAMEKLRGIFSVVCQLQKSTQLWQVEHWALLTLYNNQEMAPDCEKKPQNNSIWEAGSLSLWQAYQNWYNTMRNIRKGKTGQFWFVLRHSSMEQQL